MGDKEGPGYGCYHVQLLWFCCDGYLNVLQDSKEAHFKSALHVMVFYNYIAVTKEIRMMLRY